MGLIVGMNDDRSDMFEHALILLGVFSIRPKAIQIIRGCRIPGLTPRKYIPP